MSKRPGANLHRSQGPLSLQALGANNIEAVSEPDLISLSEVELDSDVDLDSDVELMTIIARNDQDCPRERHSDMNVQDQESSGVRKADCL